jgi:uncharacterized protein YigE (DUF2233 family)
MRKIGRGGLLFVALLLAATSSRAEHWLPPGYLVFQDEGYFTRTIDPRKEDLRLFYNDDQAHLLADFPSLEKFVTSKGEHLLFAANAGMFQPDSKPVGLLVQDGVQQSPLNLNKGAGNFFMKPNGVFLINEKHEAMVIESSSYTALLTPVTWATQSGPLLVFGGHLHPDLKKGSKNLNIRSGIGVRKDGTIVFAISTEEVNFYDFASLFLERLKCPDALYLDGSISAFYVSGMKDTVSHSFGAMFGLVEKAKSP